MMAREELEAI
jgi:hypothetical protein